MVSSRESSGRAGDCSGPAARAPAAATVAATAAPSSSSIDHHQQQRQNSSSSRSRRQAGPSLPALLLALALLLAPALAAPSGPLSGAGDPPARRRRLSRIRNPLNAYEGAHRALIERLTQLRLPLSDHLVAQVGCLRLTVAAD